MEFLNQAPPILQGFWLIAFTASIIFIVQTVFSFVGGGANDLDVETELEIHSESLDHPADLFTFKNLVYFFIGFGWTGVLFFEDISNVILLFALAIFVGLLFVLLFFMVIKQLLKLGEDNSFQISETLLKSAEVYLTIPEKMSGKGKIHISVRGAFHELEAQTEGSALPSGTQVVVKDISPENILIVSAV